MRGGAYVSIGVDIHILAAYFVVRPMSHGRAWTIPANRKEEGMFLKNIAAAVLTPLFVTAAALPANNTQPNNAEEIVFSATGATMNLQHNSTGKTQTAFGFWIWCAGSAAPGSNGGYQNANACQGAMYFYDLGGHTFHVVGDVTEGPDGIYTMNVLQGTAAQLFSNTLNPAFTCMLQNVTPDAKGPGQGVKVACAFLDPSLGGGSGTASVDSAVVNVTGPA